MFQLPFKANSKIFGRKIEDITEKKKKVFLFHFFFEYMPAHANVIFEGMYLASCVIIMRTSDLTQFNLKRNNPPLTRVLRTQYSADLN